MLISNLECTGFRNLAPLQIVPSPEINVIYGENAQGKTNLLESIWMCSGMKSFRGAKDAARNVGDMAEEAVDDASGQAGAERERAAHIADPGRN